MAKNPFRELALAGISEEKEIPTSLYLKESVAVSLATVCETLGVTKKQVINHLLDVALEEFVQALYESRPDLMQDDPSPEEPDRKSWFVVKPSAVREGKQQFKGALQFKLRLDEAS